MTQPEISVIMPSYNKYPQNLFTLLTLNNQTFDLSRVEVILVDDGSTDDTRVIPHRHAFRFRLRYIRTPTNIGRPRARNRGVQAAQGRLLVFLDAEMLVEPTYLQRHYELHQADASLVVCGAMLLKGAYTMWYPDFSEAQKAHVYQFLALSDAYRDLSLGLKPPPDHKVCLFDEAGIAAGCFKLFSFDKPISDYYENVIFRVYGDHFNGFALSWILFFTGNVSVRRELLLSVGLFEEYDGYGWDDSEMGYRLYKRGARFFHDRHNRVYHQEHPVSVGNLREAHLNFWRFREKYPGEIDVAAMALAYLPQPKYLNEINLVVCEYHRLQRERPGRYLRVAETLHGALRAVALRLRDGEPVTRLYERFDWRPEPYYAERWELVQNNMFLDLVGILDHLLSL